MDKNSPSGFHHWVPSYGPTLGSNLRDLGPGSHLRVLGPTFPVCLYVKYLDAKVKQESMQMFCLDISPLQRHKNESLINLLKFFTIIKANILIYHA